MQCVLLAPKPFRIGRGGVKAGRLHLAFEQLLLGLIEWTVKHLGTVGGLRQAFGADFLWRGIQEITAPLAVAFVELALHHGQLGRLQRGCQRARGRFGLVQRGLQPGACFARHAAHLRRREVTGHLLLKLLQCLGVSRQLSLAVPGLELNEVCLELQALCAIEVCVIVQHPVRQLRGLVVGQPDSAAAGQRAQPDQHHHGQQPPDNSGGMGTALASC